MVLFMMAGSAAALIIARAIQGFETGLAITTLAATILDTDIRRQFNSAIIAPRSRGQNDELRIGES
jgi:hypothetical protein